MQLPSRFSGGQLIALNGGLTNRSYRLSLPVADYFLRVGTRHAARLGVWRTRELVLHRLAAEYGLAPELHFMDPKQRLMITDWIEPVMPPAQWVSESGLRSLAELVARVHALPAPEGTALDLAQHLHFYLARICLRDPRISQLFPRMLARIKTLPAIPAVLCHNDISPANLLGSPAKLVDWEYAGVGDPAFDLACLARSFSLDATALRRLLEQYQAQGGRCDLIRVQTMLPVVDFVGILWANVFWESSGEEQYKTLLMTQLAQLADQEGIS